MVANAALKVGLNNDTFIIYGLISNDTGYYKVNITGGCNSVWSDSVSLTIKLLTVLTYQPVLKDLCPGSTANLVVNTSQSNKVNYQWYKNNQMIGLNDDSLILTNLTNADTGYYKVRVLGECNNIFSDSVKLTLKDAPKIVTQPKAQNVCIGSNAALTVDVLFTGVLDYKWMKGNVDLKNNSNELAINNITDNDAGYYRAIITSTCNVLQTDSVLIAAINCGSAIHENVLVANKVFPNPFSNMLHISYASKSTKDAMVYINDMSGKVVYSAALKSKMGENKQQIEIQTISSGSYLLHLEVDGEKSQYKLLKED